MSSPLKTDPLTYHPPIVTRLEAQLIAELLIQGQAINEWNLQSRHATREERSAAMRRLKMIDDLRPRFPLDPAVVL
jgi:hypothetical protein